jgi:hypothetical protein
MTLRSFSVPLESEPAEPMPDPKSLPLMHRILVKLLVGRDGGPPRWFFALFAFSALALHAFAWTIFAAEWRTLHGYAETTCTVMAKRVEEFGGDETTYRPDVRIHYTVGGREYDTWTYDSTRAAVNDQRASREALGQFALNGRYPCWYDPADPSKVVVVRGHAGFTWIFLAVSAAMAALGVGCLVRRGQPASSNGAGKTESSGWLADEIDSLVRQLSTPVATPSDLDTTPLDANITSSVTHRLSRRKPHVLVFTPVWSLYVTSLVFMAVGGGVTALGWWGDIDNGIFALLIGPLFAFVGSAMMFTADRHKFDRHRDIYRRSTLLLLSRPIPLGSIRAVQLLTDVPREQKQDNGPPTLSYHHQINLVLYDPSKPRRIILEQGDREVTLHFGRELANFLSVPLYVGTPPAASKPTDRAGLTSRLLSNIFNRKVE